MSGKQNIIAAYGGAAAPTTIASFSPADDGFDLGNYTVRNIVTTSASAGGTQIRVTFTSHSVASAIDNSSVGIRTGANGSTVSTPVELLFSGASGPGTWTGLKTSDWANLTVSPGDPIVVIIDFGAASSSKHADGIQSCYYAAGTNSYNVASVSYATNANVYCISSVEVR